MLNIPSGTARIGAADLHGHALPVQAIAMQSFDIDVTEVTIRAYARCVDEGPCTPPEAGENIRKHHRNNGCPDARSWFLEANKPPANEAAVTCVTPVQAAQYCSFAHKRLAREEEWEYAARGNDFLRFPWGNADPTSARVPPCHERPAGVRLVGTAPADNSQFGVLDMAGSKREITVSGSGYKARGASTGLLGVGESARAAYRDDVDSSDGPAQDTTFRCALSSGPPSPPARSNY